MLAALQQLDSSKINKLISSATGSQQFVSIEQICVGKAKLSVLRKYLVLATHYNKLETTTRSGSRVYDIRAAQWLVDSRIMLAKLANKELHNEVVSAFEKAAGSVRDKMILLRLRTLLAEVAAESNKSKGLSFGERLYSLVNFFNRSTAVPLSPPVSQKIVPPAEETEMRDLSATVLLPGKGGAKPVEEVKKPLTLTRPSEGVFTPATLTSTVVPSIDAAASSGKAIATVAVRSFVNITAAQFTECLVSAIAEKSKKTVVAKKADAAEEYSVEEGAHSWVVNDTANKLVVTKADQSFEVNKATGLVLVNSAHSEALEMAVRTVMSSQPGPQKYVEVCQAETQEDFNALVNVFINLKASMAIDASQTKLLSFHQALTQDEKDKLALFTIPLPEAPRPANTASPDTDSSPVAA